MKNLRWILEVLVVITIVSQSEARNNRPLDLFSSSRSDELNALEKESLKQESPLIIPASRAEQLNGGTVLPNGTIQYPTGTFYDNGEFTCMDKVMVVQEIVYEDEVRCNHVFYDNCYEAYKMVYKPQINEQCRENFKKDCNIEYEDVANHETVRVCSTKADRNCSISGKETCTTAYTTVCETKVLNYNSTNSIVNCQKVQKKVCWSDPQNLSKPQECRNITTTECSNKNNTETKGFPETNCKKVPCKVCGPEKCPIVNTTICEDKEKTFVTSVPKETCEIKPFKICVNETMSLPSLELVNECVQVPKEVCALEKVNPKQIVRPVVKKWCVKKDKLGKQPFPVGRSNDVIDEDNLTEEETFTTDATYLEEESITEVPYQLYNYVNAPEAKVEIPSQQFDSTNFDKLTDFKSVNGAFNFGNARLLVPEN